MQHPTPKILPTPKYDAGFHEAEGDYGKRKLVDTSITGKSSEDRNGKESSNKTKLNTTNEHHSSYEDDEHSISVSLTADRSISMDSLDDDDDFHDMDRTRNSLLSMFAEGMLCGPPDCSYDRRREDTDDHSTGKQLSTSESLNCHTKSDEFLTSTKDKLTSKKLPTRKPVGEKKSSTENAEESAKTGKDFPIKTNPSNNSDSISSSKARKDKKKALKESMEKVVLRALATGETSSMRDIDAQASVDGSTKSNFTYSSKKSMASKVKRISSWVRERVPKRK
jgi:hypothetical protein